MLRNIPANLSPELVRILMEMGHGDEILLADANFPGHHLHPRTVRADGLMIPDLLRSILTLMPLDRYSDYQVALMETVGDDPRPPVWDVYEQIWTEAEAAAGDGPDHRAHGLLRAHPQRLRRRADRRDRAVREPHPQEGGPVTAVVRSARATVPPLLATSSMPRPHS